jgi:hypothetical protein
LHGCNSEARLSLEDFFPLFGVVHEFVDVLLIVFLSESLVETKAQQALRSRNISMQKNTWGYLNDV